MYKEIVFILQIILHSQLKSNRNIMVVEPFSQITLMIYLLPFGQLNNTPNLTYNQSTVGQGYSIGHAYNPLELNMFYNKFQLIMFHMHCF